MDDSEFTPSRRQILGGLALGAIAWKTATRNQPTGSSAHNKMEESHSRPLESTEDREIRIPEDYDSLQVALSNVPYVLSHTWKIRVTEPIREDVVVPAYIASGTAFDGVANHLQILGNPDEPVSIGSLMVGSTQGTANPLIRGFRVRDNVPYVDEPFSIVTMGCQEVVLDRITFSSDVYGGVVSYNSNVTIKDTDFGSGELHYGTMVKRGGYMTINGAVGELTGSPFVLNSGTINVKLADVSGREGRIQHRGGGIVFDREMEKTFVPFDVESYK